MYFGEKDSEQYESLNKAAKQITDEILIVGTNIEESFEYFKIDKAETPKLVYQKSTNNSDFTVYQGTWTPYDVQRFIFIESTKYYSEFKPRVVDLVFEYRMPTLFLVGDYERLGRKMAEKWQGHPFVVLIDFQKEALPRFAQFFGINPNQKKFGMLVDARQADESNYKKYMTDGLVSEDNLTEMIEKWHRGELMQTLKTESVPPEEEQNGPIYKLVGRTFEDHVFDKEKDVMVWFDAPWCSHCQQFKETFEAVQKLKPEISYMRIDSSANDVLGHPIKEFPTIKFFPKYNKEGITFSEERTVDSLLTFIEGEIEAKTQPGDKTDEPKKSKKKAKKAKKSGKKDEL